MKSPLTCICYSKSVKSVVSWNHWNFLSFHVITVSVGDFVKSLNFLGVSRNNWKWRAHFSLYYWRTISCVSNLWNSRMMKELGVNMQTPQPNPWSWTSLCVRSVRRRKIVTKGVVVRPILSKEYDCYHLVDTWIWLTCCPRHGHTQTVA